MARKYDLISELYERTNKTVIANPQSWQSFLRSACYNYRLRFDEQLLVFAQRPNATAVLEIERWNERFGRWVNKGARGIAVFADENRSRQRLKHYFDISDTHESRYSKPVPVWQMNPAYTEEIIDALEGTFGALEGRQSLEAAILSAAKNAVEDNIPDYLADLLRTTQDSFLEELDDLNVEVLYKRVVTNSVAYMLMSRLGLDTSDYFEHEDFAEVMNFNTPDTLNAIGFATSDIAEMGLGEISRTILSLNRQNRTFAEPARSEYNVVAQSEERSKDNERNHLHDAGGLPSARPDAAGAEGRNLGIIRRDAAQIPEGTSPGPVLQPADEMRPDGASGGNGTQSYRDGGSLSPADGTEGGLDREPESDGHDELGAENEQPPIFGTGNREGGSDFRLDYYDRSHEDRSLPFLGATAVIHEILRTTPHLKASKEEIRGFLETHPDDASRTEYIKSIFNNDFTEVILSNGERYGYKTYQNVLQLWKGSYLSREAQSFYDWGAIAQHFEGMWLLGELYDTAKPLPSLEGQMNFITQAGEEKAPAFSFSQEIIDRVLTRGSGISEGKLRIYEQFQKSLSTTENVAFLKEEYGWGGAYPIIAGTNIDESHDAKGIHLSIGLAPGQPHLDLNWKQAEKRLSELIQMGRYLNPKELERYPAWLTEREEQRRESAERKGIADILKAAPPESTPEMVYEYHLGDPVYLGADEYEILSFDEERVVLYDTRFPLFRREETREAFDRMVAENPTNDHLKVPVPQPEEKAAAPEAPPQDTEQPSVFDDYSSIKANHPDSLLLYQVGDFFEALGSDAETVAQTLDLTMSSRSISATERTPMCGFPQNVLQRYLDMLLDRGFDVTVATAENSKLEARTIVSAHADAPLESYPVGRIDYLGSSGAVQESIEYTNEEQFRKDIREENNYGVPMSIIVYRGEDGSTIDTAFVSELDPPPQGFQIVDSPLLADRSQEMLRQAEQPAPAEEQAPDGSLPELSSPAFASPKRSSVQSFDLHPEIPMADRHNFDLTSHEVAEVGKKERFRRNVMAIQLLKKCQSENRYATPEEQQILSNFVGWGGLSEAFDENNDAWGTEYLELLTILTPEEYESAKESTLTAFYTPPAVISGIYKALEQMGFRTGNLLEPSCGIGNFIGMLPSSMQESKVYGVELDTISAGIAAQLYQKSSIAAAGFENVELPDSFFDGIVGNVPFGDFKVLDKRYDKYHFLIHDFFFAKSLDKLRPGGVMALVTSKGTMDKESPAVRKYIAQRAELLGAIRLPNNTFKGNAGTEVVSDILILQKRDRLIDIEPDWVHLDVDENGNRMNAYFVQHPEMILGEVKTVSGRFGEEQTVIPYAGADLANQIEEAVANIHGEITDYQVDEELSEEDTSIPADPTVRNFSYTVLNDTVYYRENSRMAPVTLSETAANRVKGMIAIRDTVRRLLEMQTEDYPDSEIREEQGKLNRIYDSFTSKYGLINSRANVSAFSQDSSFSLLSALEVLGDDGQLERKADMFYKRTIKPHTPVTSVDTASEALAVSIGEKACIDMEYMSALSGKTEEELFSELKGVIFLNPLYEYGDHPESKYLMADEYLSGNVREKLRVARKSAELYPEDYTVNVEALEKVQPKDLTASEIFVRLGSTWVPPEIVEQFIFEFLDTPRYAQWQIKAHYSKYTSEWNIENKTYDRANVKAYSTYGTPRINAYRIIEETLNLKDVRIFDYVEEPDGKKKPVLNSKETAIAQAKQELIKQGFQDWVWADPARRERLCRIYNEKFNSVRPREYDGSHITFSGMNPEIEMREHQKNAVAHILYGGNTLLAHCVGAGKTYEMAAAAMESKRLGLCNKSLFVVPNHLTEQWAAEFLQLYPAAKILVATKKDFETKSRKRFCGRIATGDYDAVIIGHSQFEKIPMSIERQRAILEQELQEILAGISEAKRNRGENFTVKQLQKSKKSVELKLKKLNDQSRKDDLVTFEELGIDRLFIDESHFYKNCAKRCA